MSFRDILITLNVVVIAAILGVIVFRVFSIKRNPEPEPANVRTFLDDDALEGRRLERVLGFSLLFVAILAGSLAVYFLFEPDRQVSAEENNFVERSLERGAVLFANKQSEHYNAEFSLLCADCHGVDGTGGTASATLQPEADKCLEEENKNNVDIPECLPKQVAWTAPDLTLAGLRYTSVQLNEIITYGRPGTPMPAWGVKSGKGAKNAQSIHDLVNYIESLTTTPEKAQKRAGEMIDEYKESAAELVTNKAAALAEARTALATGQANGTTSAVALADLRTTVETTQAELAAATAYNDEVQGLSDGAVLFRLNCARCHTKGWSYRENDPARTDIPALAPQGSGAYGPSLRDGSVLLQFPGRAGSQGQFDWVALGVPKNDQYGARGISSGRMPHFGQALTDDQIKAIVEYERSL